MLTTEEGNKLNREDSVDIDNSDPVYCAGSSGSSSGSVSKIPYCTDKRASDTEESKGHVTGILCGLDTGGSFF